MRIRTSVILALAGILLIVAAGTAYVRDWGGSADERAVRALAEEFAAQLRSDQIDITRISRQGEGYVVQGAFVSKTDAGSASLVPVYFQVVKEKGEWRVAAYQEVAVPDSLR